MCTMFIAFIISDICPAVPDYIEFKDTVRMTPFLDAVSTLNNVITLYLLVWKDKSFQRQLFSTIKLIWETRSAVYVQ